MTLRQRAIEAFEENPISYDIEIEIALMKAVAKIVFDIDVTEHETEYQYGGDLIYFEVETLWFRWLGGYDGCWFAVKTEHNKRYYPVCDLQDLGKILDRIKDDT